MSGGCWAGHIEKDTHTEYHVKSTNTCLCGKVIESVSVRAKEKSEKCALSVLYILEVSTIDMQMFKSILPRTDGRGLMYSGVVITSAGYTPVAEDQLVLATGVFIPENEKN